MTSVMVGTGSMKQALGCQPFSELSGPFGSSLIISGNNF